MTHVLTDLNEYLNNYPNLFRSALRYLDVRSLNSIHDWWEYPITAVMTCRGCTHNCAICGGSRYALSNSYSRGACAYRRPEKVAADILSIAGYTNAPIFVVGDLRQAGDSYASAVLSGLKAVRPRNPVVLELFTPLRNRISRRWRRSGLQFRDSPGPMTKTSGGFREILRQRGHGGFHPFCPRSRMFQIRCFLHDRRSPADFPIGFGNDRLLWGSTENFGRRLNPFISPLAPFLIRYHRL